MNEELDQDDSNVGLNSRDERVKNILAQYKDAKCNELMLIQSKREEGQI